MVFRGDQLDLVFLPVPFGLDGLPQRRVEIGKRRFRVEHLGRFLMGVGARAGALRGAPRPVSGVSFRLHRRARSNRGSA